MRNARAISLVKMMQAGLMPAGALARVMDRLLSEAETLIKDSERASGHINIQLPDGKILAYSWDSQIGGWQQQL